MRIAICSDIHDNIWALERALPLMRQAQSLVFCGDFCAPFTLVQLAEGFPGPIHVVWGNNDGDKWLLTRQASRFPQVELHGELAEFAAGELRLVCPCLADYNRTRRIQWSSGLASSPVPRSDGTCRDGHRSVPELPPAPLRIRSASDSR